MLLSELTNALGYPQSPLYREDGGGDLVAPEDQHWLRAARRAGVHGTYFFKTTPDTETSSANVRPAVHVAEAETPEKAREIHRQLWNQGLHPFLIVLLPGQVRVYSGFAYDPASENTGTVTSPIATSDGIHRVLETLSAFTAEAINRGDIWEQNAAHLGSEQRVDTTLLKNLSALSDTLETRFNLSRTTSQALIGKFVYLAYLRARDILSDKWLRDEAGVDPATLFRGETFASTVTLDGFRRLVKAIESRFNGKLFPIAWGSRTAPKAGAVQLVARVFAGEEVTGQAYLGFRAYDFASIPVEFLSSIYEQFLHCEGDGEEAEEDASDPEKRGAHYTPEPLAEYLVSEVHSSSPLRLGMKVLDPCCGSGVFLVVAFRRLVEMQCRLEQRESLHASELRELLVTSIYAVERNPIACQIAGFSLILTMLGYVDPPELHRNRAFKFPTLVGNNLFPEDFFNDQGRFWQQVVSPNGKGIRFDVVVGNPPWVELEPEDPDCAHIIAWSKKHAKDYALARARTGEAFAWRVVDCLSEKGVVGLILHAKTLTNDQLEGWRKRFFSEMRVRRITNLANLAYIVFASAQAPCITLTYTTRHGGAASEGNILHLGPFVANQRVTVPRRGSKRRTWSIGFSESEIKVVPSIKASTGKAAVWKQALWAGTRDEVALRKLRTAFSATLGKLAEAKGWNIALGLQLRSNAGTARDPNEQVFDKEGQNLLKGMKVLNHKALVKEKGGLVIDQRFLGENTFGTFVRKRGGPNGLFLIAGPRLLLWNDFAAYSEAPFIIRHSKVGISGGTCEEMKAVAAVWNSSFAAYLLFFVLSSDWGIDRSLIDKGDAENLPFPEWTPARQRGLCAAWEEAAALESRGVGFVEVKAFLDQRVAEVLGLPASVALVVSEFFRVRYQLNKGKNPAALRHQPNDAELTAYANRLRSELDGYLGGKAHHRVTVLCSNRGVCTSVTLTKQKLPIAVEVHEARGAESARLEALLQAAEVKYSQWAYVKRSVRLFDGDTIHLIKPPRRLEWTETQAMLDADDIIAEAVESSQRPA